ncbi:MAG: stage III sporulation protein SpoIIIAB [Bacillota bacterium]
MTIKLVGAIIVVGASSILGFALAAPFAQRPRVLRALQAGLERLETEIDYGLVPLPAALRRSARGLAFPASRLLETAADELETGDGLTAGEAWTRSLEHWDRESSWNAEDREILGEIGGWLGSSDRENQKRHLRHVLDRLKYQEALARDEQSRGERLFKYLGVLGGLALAIILL